MTAILHEALDLFDLKLAAVENELLAWLNEHPLPEAAKKHAGKTDPAVPEGNGGGPWRWDIFTILNANPVVQTPIAPDYGPWYGLPKT